LHQQHRTAHIAIQKLPLLLLESQWQQPHAEQLLYQIAWPQPSLALASGTDLAA
jgi:hypothetical protein